MIKVQRSIAFFVSMLIITCSFSACGGTTETANSSSDVYNKDASQTEADSSNVDVADKEQYENSEVNSKNDKNKDIASNSSVVKKPTSSVSSEANSSLVSKEDEYDFSYEYETDDDALSEVTDMQIIPDVTLSSGIQLLSQKDHTNGEAFSVLGTHNFYGNYDVSPVWRLAQWDSGPCLIANRIKSDATKITDGVGRTFAYNPKQNKMTFELDTSIYYKGRPAVSGDYWPHLLIEQNNFLQSYDSDSMRFLKCNADKFLLSFDIRLTSYSEKHIAGDWTRAAQFLMYFYVKGVSTNDFCWFGVQLFDNRYDNSDNYIAYDGGKPDASGAMIYSIGSKNVYANSGRTLYSNGSPSTDGEWVHVEIDLKPYLKNMLNVGRADGYFKASSLSELYISGMNVGWETIATFDHTMEMRNLELVSHIK